jgi:hypothetical protein
MTRQHRLFVFIVFVAIASSGGTLHAQRQKGFFGTYGGGIFFVAANEAVQKEIGLNSDRATEVKSIVEHYGQDMRAAQSAVRAKRQTLRDLSPEERENRQRKITEDRAVVIKKLNEKYVAQLKAAVSPLQFERLQQITWQAYGSQALATDSNLAKPLELNGDQVKKIVAINSICDAKVRQLYGVTTLQEALIKVQEFEKERDGKALDVLTKEQQDKLLRLKSKPFDLNLLAPPERGANN